MHPLWNMKINYNLTGMFFFFSPLLWTIHHFSCSLLLSFSLIGLSLFTWHCSSRHRTSSQRSHLPNRHIHSLQKCQADKVSNPISCFEKEKKIVCVLNLFHFIFLRFLAWGHVKRVPSLPSVLVPLLFTKFHIKFKSVNNMLRKIIHPRLLFLEAVYENIMFRKYCSTEMKVISKSKSHKPPVFTVASIASVLILQSFDSAWNTYIIKKLAVTHKCRTLVGKKVFSHSSGSGRCCGSGHIRFSCTFHLRWCQICFQEI